MGAIKDLVDLVTQLSNSVNDRKLASELNAIQSTIGQLQSEHATLHERNIELREENLSLKDRIQRLEADNSRLQEASSAGPNNVPTCPNCSTSSKPYYMSPIDTPFKHLVNGTHECRKCHFTM